MCQVKHASADDRCYRRTRLTLGITALFPGDILSPRGDWDLDVGSSHPRCVAASMGWTVRPVKTYASWVNTVVRQVVPYLSFSLALGPHYERTRMQSL